MNKNITLGKWRIRDNKTEVVCGSRLVANTGCYSSSSEPTRLVNEINAQFIYKCANQCQAVNSSNPMAVADNIEKMYQMLGIILRNSTDQQTREHCKTVLSAIEKEV